MNIIEDRKEKKGETDWLMKELHMRLNPETSPELRAVSEKKVAVPPRDFEQTILSGADKRFMEEDVITNA